MHNWKDIKEALSHATPSEPFYSLHNSGKLRSILPEVDQLFGIPQEKKWHPEIDTGVHVMMVIDRAAVLSQDIQVRFAALVHDLGKGVTPFKYLPKHPNHEKRGVALVKNIGKRFEIPSDILDFSVLVTEHHGNAHCFNTISFLKKYTFLKDLRKVVNLYGDSVLDKFLLASTADYQGRPGYENQPLPFEEEIRKAFHKRRKKCL